MEGGSQGWKDATEPGIGYGAGETVRPALS